MIAISVATADDLPWIAELELRHYGPMRAVAAERLAEWHDANPNGFLIVREHDAHVTVLPLKPPMLRALMDGSKSENDIRAADIFTPADRKSVRALYIESVIAEGIEVLGALVLTFNRHVMRLAEPEQMEEIVVCPSTRAGDLLVANLGFERSASSPYFVAKYEELVRRTTQLRSRLGAQRQLNSSR
ncbi:MAG TPA: hypothetical protein VJZ76_13295 [Thermoanaerobaculia bacterium]|nr:hypothetical protein [Thermoanaerobaculia bacterium]